MSGTAQFEGRTAEEAVARARATLGDSGALRCWKTRRGGVGGFFAKEVFVAGLTPPPGSKTTRGRASRAKPGPKETGSGRASVPHAAPEEGTQSAPESGPFRQDTSAGPEDHLTGLVEATSDQVSLGSLAIPAEAFDQVLAEAQAALTREREGNDVAVPPSPASPGTEVVTPEEPGVAEHELQPPDDGQAGRPPKGRENATASRGPASSEPGVRPASTRPTKKVTRSKAKGGRTPSAPRSRSTTHGTRGRAAHIPDLRPGLRGLGVPDSFVPRGQRPSLDQLASVMGRLPVPPALPTRSDAVVAVIGSDRDLDRTVDLVRAQLSLGQRDVSRFVGSSVADLVGPADVTSAESRRLGRQIARRRSSGRPSLLALQAGPGMPLGRELRGLLDQATPDYVLAAVGAACKRVDVEHLIGELPRLDALALWDLSGTRTPAELLGVHPIAFVEGEPSSPLGWTLTLAGRVLDRGGR
jgi:hypothetical protein